MAQEIEYRIVVVDKDTEEILYKGETQTYEVAQMHLAAADRYLKKQAREANMWGAK